MTKSVVSFHRKWRGQRITALLARDGEICSLCPRRLDRRLKDPDDGNYITFDHVIPSSRGGLTVLSNLRLAHRSCNTSRGNEPIMPEDEELR
jgi:5-methylcytosine-specific restriction endonuclease McrA